MLFIEQNENHYEILRDAISKIPNLYNRIKSIDKEIKKVAEIVTKRPEICSFEKDPVSHHVFIKFDYLSHQLFLQNKHEEPSQFFRSNITKENKDQVLLDIRVSSLKSVFVEANSSYIIALSEDENRTCQQRIDAIDNLCQKILNKEKLPTVNELKIEFYNNIKINLENEFDDVSKKIEKKFSKIEKLKNTANGIIFLKEPHKKEIKEEIKKLEQHGKSDRIKKTIPDSLTIWLSDTSKELSKDIINSIKTVGKNPREDLYEENKTYTPRLIKVISFKEKIAQSKTPEGQQNLNQQYKTVRDSLILEITTKNQVFQNLLNCNQSLVKLTGKEQEVSRDYREEELPAENLFFSNIPGSLEILPQDRPDFCETDQEEIEGVKKTKKINDQSYFLSKYFSYFIQRIKRWFIRFWRNR